MWFKSSFTSNCCSVLPELSHHHGCANHSWASSPLPHICLVKSEQQDPKSRLVGRAWQGQREETGDGSSSADLNVSGSVRDDKHFPLVTNIPPPPMSAAPPVDRSRAVICSSCWLCWGMLPRETSSARGVERVKWFLFRWEEMCFLLPGGESLGITKKGRRLGKTGSSLQSFTVCKRITIWIKTRLQRGVSSELQYV